MSSTTDSVAKPLWSFNCALEELREYSGKGKRSVLKKGAERFERLAKNLFLTIAKEQHLHSTQSCKLEVTKDLTQSPLFCTILTKLFAKALKIKLNITKSPKVIGTSEIQFSWENGYNFEDITSQFKEWKTLTDAKITSFFAGGSEEEEISRCLQEEFGSVKFKEVSKIERLVLAQQANPEAKSNSNEADEGNFSVPAVVDKFPLEEKDREEEELRYICRMSKSEAEEARRRWNDLVAEGRITYKGQRSGGWSP